MDWETVIGIDKQPQKLNAAHQCRNVTGPAPVRA